MFRSLRTSLSCCGVYRLLCFIEGTFVCTAAQVRVKSTHIGMIGVFVSNLNNSGMRSLPRISPEGRSQARGGLACNWRKGESRTNSLGKFNSSRSMKGFPSQDRIFFFQKMAPFHGKFDRSQHGVISREDRKMAGWHHFTKRSQG